MTMSDISGKISAGNYKGAVDDITDNAKDMTETAKQKTAAAVDTAQHAAMDTISDLEKQIRKNPTQSALIAAGVGLMIGLLISR